MRCEAIYPGIDLVYYGHGRPLEHDFVVAPGADPRAIAWSIGATSAGTATRAANFTVP